MQTATIIQCGTLTVYGSRWGYHPCDYTVFLQLKEYHKMVLLDYKNTKRHDRYYAKLAKNRKGPAPAESIGTCIAEYQRVLKAYRTARYPQPKPEDVQTMDLPRYWVKDLERLHEHYHH